MDTSPHEPADNLPPLPPAAKEECTWALGAHLSAPIGAMLLASLSIPVGGVLGPLIIWLVKRDQSEYIGAHAKEALNANISYLLYAIPIGLVFFLLMLTIILIPLVFLAGAFLTVLYLYWVIRAAIAANNGGFYRYPFNLRLIR